uniref:Cilium assembly protein DZIP1 n=1 Tax=Sphenodon punctatus TaxID=8508 RepID=A0A8D0H6J6_SPHPU
MHLGHITFCTAERERCPHCQAPADPLLLKLVRLAQLSIEYLLHSQDYLSAQLHGLEETLRGVTMEKDQLRKEATRRTQEIKLLKEECKRRKKMISTQQTMLEAGARYHQCQFCEKAFMNYSFLHSHIQRRHPEESCIEQKKKAQTDKLQDEIDKLKEQLQLTKSQLEAEQHAHMVKFSKEYEEHKSKEEELLQSFHKWKQEEKEKLADEIEKIKEMFMKEFKELTSKNTDLENQLLELQKSNKHLKSNLGTLKDSHEFAEERQQNPEDHYNMMQLLEKQESRWFSKVQALQQEHEKEKHQLLSQIEKLKSSVTEDLNASNIFYKKRIEELGQRLQEQNELIIAQKQQVCFYYCWVSKTMKILLFSHCWLFCAFLVNSPVQHIVEPKSSLSATYAKKPLISETEKNEPKVGRSEPKVGRSEPKVGRSKHYLSNVLKTNPSLTKELRVVLEQTLVEKLESLGIKAGIRGIPSDHLNQVLVSVETAREEKEKQVPDIQLIREQLEYQINLRIGERVSCSRLFSSSRLTSEGMVTPKLFFLMGCLYTGNLRTDQSGPFSSIVLPKPAKQSSTTVPPAEQKTTIVYPGISNDHIGAQIQKLTEQVEKSLSHPGKENKPAGGVNVSQAFINKDAQELKFTEVDDEDWDISSVEEESSLIAKDDRDQTGAAIQKNDSNGMVHAWGAPKGKLHLLEL